MDILIEDIDICRQLRLYIGQFIYPVRERRWGKGGGLELSLL